MLLAAIPEPSRTGDVLFAFLSILFASAPYLLAGAIVSGLISAFLPAKFFRAVLPKNKFIATILAGFLGIILPVSKCAIVPITRRLLQKGLPLPCAITYMLAAPILNPIAILSTLAAFNEYQKISAGGDLSGASMTIARLSLGFIIAVVAGLIFLCFKPGQILHPQLSSGLDSQPDPLADASFNAKLTHAMRSAMSDFVETAMYFTIGAFLVAAFNTHMDAAKLAASVGKDFVAVPTLMTVALILSLCSSADAIVAAPIIVFSLASKLAFLVFGPMMDIKLLFMYSTMFRKRIIVILLLGLFLTIALTSGPWLQFIQSLAANTKP